MKRRTFFQSAALGGMAAAMALLTACSSDPGTDPAAGERYTMLGEVLQQPVFKKELFSAPVLIKSVELLQYENSYLCRVRSEDGAEGISVAHNDMRFLVPIFLHKVQPDNYYFGGFIRSMRVARMADALGKTCIPHMSGGALGYIYNTHFVSVLPNAGEHHEFKGYRTHVPFDCPTSSLKVEDGKIAVPTGPGLGIEIDPGFIEKHEHVKV